MAKQNKQLNENEKPDFQTFVKLLPDDYRKLLETLKISSFEDLCDIAALIGIDVDKMVAYAQEHGTDTVPSAEEVAFDDDDPNGEYSRMLKKLFDNHDDEADSDDDDDELDPFKMPDKVFFEDLPALAYHLRIKLNNCPVPVWREVEVPSNISLAFFAFVVMDAMGWCNVHLHQFFYKGTYYQNSASIKQNEDMFGCWGKNSRTYNTEEFPVSALFQEKGVRVKFEYDFGDSWMHEIWLKGVRMYAPGEHPSIKILKGKGACPPEDCGGIWGYERLLELASKKRKSAEEKDELEWYDMDSDFDPNEFDQEFVEEQMESLWKEALSL